MFNSIVADDSNVGFVLRVMMYAVIKLQTMEPMIQFRRRVRMRSKLRSAYAPEEGWPSSMEGCDPAATSGGTRVVPTLLK